MENGNAGRPYGNGWQRPLIGVLWAVLIAVLGWIATDAASSRAELTRQVAEHIQRIAILEENARNTKESLHRIEAALAELNVEQRKQRR